jgi:predicted nucleic acid-binding protein
MKPMRIYADTSVIGGCVDPERAADSLRLIEAVRQGRLVLLLSDVVLAELADAPARARSVLQSLPVTAVEKVKITEEVLQLRDAYLTARIVGQRWADDAAHVAAATMARADAMVSWDFEHTVRPDKVKAYNQVNVQRGHGILTIVTPKEVVSDEKTGGA